MIKKILYISLIVTSIIGCSKEEETTPIQTSGTSDTVQPVISIIGNNDDTVSLNSTYIEKGATAQDNIDGDISSSIITTGTINMNLKGLYHKYYDVSDAAGNNAARATRNVYVVNDADFLIGNYVATPNCGATSTSQYNTDLTTSNTTNNEIYFTAVILNPLGFNITGEVIADSIYIPLQTIGSDDYAGTGNIIGNNFTLNATNSFQNYSCVIPHVKQ